MQAKLHDIAIPVKVNILLLHYCQYAIFCINWTLQDSTHLPPMIVIVRKGVNHSIVQLMGYQVIWN